jgi:predicted phosphodiesterase
MRNNHFKRACDFVKHGRGNPLKDFRRSDEIPLGELGKIRDEKEIPEKEDIPVKIQDSIKILHLSDLHFQLQEDEFSQFTPLLTDLRKIIGLSNVSLDFIVVTGDFCDRGRVESFTRARSFIERLKKDFHVENDHCILVPGNHDFDEHEEFRQFNYVILKEEFESSYAKDFDTDVQLELANGYYLIPNCLNRRFLKFSDDLYHPLTGVEYPLDFRKSTIAHTFPEVGLQFVTLNSCWRIHSALNNKPHVNYHSLQKGLDEARSQINTKEINPNLQILRIFVLHHSIGDFSSVQIKN